MARKQTKQLLDDTERDMTILERELNDANEHRKKLELRIRAAKGNITKKRNNTKYPDSLALSLVEEIKNQDLASRILMRHIDNAAEVNDEFQRSPYLAALYSVANDPEIFKFVRVGSGWNTGVSVQIVFEAEAGDLNDWATGIREYREELNTKQRAGNSKAGQRATYWWLNNVWGTGLEIITINRRLEYSGRKAPFWRILNSGSQPLASDRRDGSFNPLSSTATDFIGLAERDIRAYFTGPFLQEKAKWMEELAELEEILQDHQRLLEEYDYEIDRISTEMYQNRSILESFGRKARFIDEDKLTNALRRLRAEGTLDAKTVELTKRGAEERVRVSVRRLKGLL